MKTAQWKYLDTLNPQALSRLMVSWRQQGGDIAVLALVCEQERDAVPELQRVMTQAGVALAGAIVPGLIVQTGIRRRGVLLLELGADWPRTIVPLSAAGGHTAAEAVKALADFAQPGQPGDVAASLLLFVDGMTPDVATLLEHLYLELGDEVNYVGSNVGSETFQPVPCVFDNASFVQDAALALLLPCHPGAALAHSYRVDESLRVATATAGNRIRQIDGRAAFEVYQELVGRAYGIELTRENFYQHAVHFPFALNRVRGEPLVRIPVACGDDGSVFCVGEVPENALLGVVRAVPTGNLDTTRTLGRWLRTHETPLALLFYCAGRLMHLGEVGATMELAALAQEAAPAAMPGLLSLGEIGGMGGVGYPAFHNATMVALPWA